jgi:mxaL protein
MYKIQRFFKIIRARRDISLLSSALVLLLIAMINPAIPLPHNIYSYMFVVDISQSMNTVDAKLDNKLVSRLDYTKKMLHDITANLPCGTKVSVGLFAGVSTPALYHPIEICSNYAAIQDTINHLDWRMAWSGNSRIRDSMLGIARTIRAFPEPAQVVYFSDGEEAPRLHAFNTVDLSNFQGGNGWLLVGIGSDVGTPIPKFDEKNQLIGYWANDSFALQPGIAQISESNIGARDNNVASSTGDRFLSKLQEAYLIDLAKLVNAQYVRGDSLQKVLSAMSNQPPARRDIAPFSVRWILASLAVLLIVLSYLPKDVIGYLRQLNKASREKLSRLASTS